MGADIAGIIGGAGLCSSRLTLKDASIALPLLLQTQMKVQHFVKAYTEEYGEAPTNLCSLAMTQ